MSRPTKGYIRLTQELEAARQRIERLKADPNHHDPMITYTDIMSCFTKTADPNYHFNPAIELDRKQATTMINAYCRRGLMRYIPLKAGGQGYEVVTGDKVKTTVTDPTQNLASKLKPYYSTAMAFLCDVSNVSPSTSVSALLELLRKPQGEKYCDLLQLKAPAPDEPKVETISPDRLETINLEHVRFAGRNECVLNNCTLYQAYAIGSALDTNPTQSDMPSLAEMPEQKRPTKNPPLRREDSTDAPF